MSKITISGGGYTDAEAIAATAKQWAILTLSGNQTTDLANTNHVEFNTIVKSTGSGISVTTGNGNQDDGIITLPAGNFEISCNFELTFSGDTGAVFLQTHDIGGTANVGKRASIFPASSSDNQSSDNDCVAVVQPSSSSTYEIRIAGVIAFIGVQAAGTSVFIREID